ncbi:hypothetical protein IEQ34_009690 [Dendrobium chrysotoxum]|uniref:Uncharacterized protein n=1 Tax=Dendrobium chrysotoxum TaxID=161865 RepID=A0AAV7H1G3_DENCH|nr:hypothetical protein IEQ34_009690 [Dendrobium chrysotoxum]
MLPLQLMTPTEYSGPLNQQYNSNEPKIRALERNCKASQENNRGPYEAKGANAAGRLLEDGEAEGDYGEFLLGRGGVGEAVGVDGNPRLHFVGIV